MTDVPAARKKLKYQSDDDDEIVENTKKKSSSVLDPLYVMQHSFHTKLHHCVIYTVSAHSKTPGLSKVLVLELVF